MYGGYEVSYRTLVYGNGTCRTLITVLRHYDGAGPVGTLGIVRYRILGVRGYYCHVGYKNVNYKSRGTVVGYVQAYLLQT